MYFNSEWSSKFESFRVSEEILVGIGTKVGVDVASLWQYDALEDRDKFSITFLTNNRSDKWNVLLDALSQDVSLETEVALYRDGIVISRGHDSDPWLKMTLEGDSFDPITDEKTSMEVDVFVPIANALKFYNDASACKRATASLLS